MNTKYLKIRSDAVLAQLNSAEIANYFESFYVIMPRTKVPPVADETPTQEECLALGITNAELVMFNEHIKQLVDLNLMSPTLVSDQPQSSK